MKRKVRFFIGYILLFFSFMLSFIRMKKTNLSLENVKTRLNKLNPNGKILCHNKNEFIESFDKVDVCIVIPFYNTREDLLNKCILSLIRQKTKYTYKVVCVDDGSPGNTLNLLLKLEKKYPDKLFVLSHKNGGVSSARNFGLKYCNCDYIGFLDHDDYVSETYLDDLMNAIKKTDCSIVKCNYGNVSNGKISVGSKLKNDIININDYNSFFKITGMVFAGLYKREIFSDIIFPTGMWYEDMITRFLIYRKVKNIVTIDAVDYFKCNHENNTSKSVWNSKSYKSIDQIYLTDYLFKDCKAKKTDDLLLEKIVLNELGSMLMVRTKSLPNDVRKLIFCYSKEIILKFKYSIRSFNFIERIILRSYLNNNVYAWKIASLCEYCVSYR